MDTFTATVEPTAPSTGRSSIEPLPARRPDLVLRSLDDGRHVVKDPHTGAYFDLGEQEHFLLAQLDGRRSAADICQAFANHFGETLAEDDLFDFLDLAREQKFLAPDQSEAAAEPAKPQREQSLLHWRFSLFDPDRLFDWLVPRLGFLWTRGFAIASVLVILTSVGIVWTNWRELVSNFQDALRWQTVVVVWVTLLLATTLHEFAHGMTCKRYGGEVHEVGFLMMFFIPCLYCNVSDAWLFRERSKRLWVTLAGGYCDLCLWALAVVLWRVTLPSTLPNYLAWVILTVLGARVVFNFNPLLKLDGYYLLSDWKGIANLQQRGADRFKKHLRRILWGSERPSPEPHGRFLTAHGLVSWSFSIVFLGIMLGALFQFLWARWGLFAFAIVIPLALVTGRGLLTGLVGGEIRRMIRKFRKRTVIWGLILTGLPLALSVIHMEDRVSGPFQVRPTVRAEVRAPVTAFVREVLHDEGDRVSPGTVIARLEIPDLTSRIAQKRAEMNEAAARLQLLVAGSRPEEMKEQRERVERSRHWRDLAQQDLERARKGAQEDLNRMEKLIAQYEAELQFALKTYDRNKALRDRGNASDAEVQEANKELGVYKAKVEQALAQRRSLQALGTRDAENELARRVKELADTEGTLKLLEAGTRPEEIEAARAHLARTKEEVRYLESQQGKLQIVSPVGGVITTARLKEKIGQYVREGDLICQVDEPQVLEAEIVLTEQDVSRVQPNFSVELKARALPFETFHAKVERIAPNAARLDPQSQQQQQQTGTVPTAAPPAKPDAPGSVIAYCRLDGVSPHLRPGMTGFARVSCGQRPVGEILISRVARFVRTEFWW